MNIIIRNTLPADYDAVDYLTREAFWNVYRPGCDEHYLSFLLRKSDIYIKELDFVAVLDGQIVGNIMFSHAKIINGEIEYPTLTFGPVSVLPELQKQGVGLQLINHGISSAKAMGFEHLFIYGRHTYYHKYGFKNAVKYGVATKNGENFEDFMALELVLGSLNNICGKYYDLVGIDYVTGFEDFDKQFPLKEKLKLPTQLFD